MSFEGSLAESPFSEVMQRIGRTTGTGILTLQGDEEIIGVTFLDGNVVSVDAVNQAPEDGLGAVLEQQGSVSRSDFAELVAENQAGGGRVVDLLVERGYLDRGQLLAALRAQTLRLCGEACGWQEGQFRFYRGEQVSFEQGIEPLGVDELLETLAGQGVERAGQAASSSPTQEAAPAPSEPATSQTSQKPAPEVRYNPADVPEIEVLKLEPQDVPTAAQLAIDAIEAAESAEGTGAVGAPEEMQEPFELATAADPSEASPNVFVPPENDLDDVELEDDPALSWMEPKESIDWSRWFRVPQVPAAPGRILGGGLLAAALLFSLRSPASFFVPFDSQARIRDGIAASVESSSFVRVDNSAKTFFLLRGVFPDTLDNLSELSLLGAQDVASEGWSYRSSPLSYQLSQEESLQAERTTRTETISGNFLLDPDFSPPELVDTPALVLLD